MDMASLTLQHHQFLLLILPSEKSKVILNLAAQLALKSPLCVLDGGNQFNVYSVVRTLRQHALHLTSILENILVARAFTCYQMTALLSNRPRTNIPLLVLDLLETFYDENVAYQECRRLLQICIEHLRRLSQNTSVLVSVHPPRQICIQRSTFLDVLRTNADTVWEAEYPNHGLEENGAHLTIHYPGIS
jgi:hypothetical protein